MFIRCMFKKRERKNRTQEEVDQIICWLTGYNQAGLQQKIEQENDFETFFAQPPPFTRIVRLSRASCAVFVLKK